MRLTQCCRLHRWKAKPEQSITTRADSFSPETLVRVGRRLKLLMMEKLQPRSSSRPFFSRLLEILPPLPEPTLGRGQRCLAGDLSKGRWRWRGRFASTKEPHGVKSHLQCYLTFPVPLFFLVLRQSWGLCKMKCATSKLPPALGRTLTTLWKAKFTVGRTSVHAFFGYSIVFLKITTSFHNFIN